MIEWLVIIGILLLLLAVFFIAPGLGVGMFLPVAGDIIDIPIAAVTALTGLVLIALGLSVGLIEYLLTTYWYVWLLAAIFLFFLFTGKIAWGIKKAKR